MTPEQLKHYQDAAATGSIADDENPLFLFDQTSTSLLVKILAKEFNIYTLIRHNLRQRGVDDKGRWVGFKTINTKKR